MSLMLPGLSSAREQMERMLREFNEEMTYPSQFFKEWSPLRVENEFQKTWFPAVEVTENDKEYLVKAQIPGLKPEEIHVEVLGDRVTISGETRQEKNEEHHDLYKSEFSYGRFYRRIPLPTEVKTDGCQAEFKDGILSLKLPKLAETNRKRIKVEVKPGL